MAGIAQWAGHRPAKRKLACWFDSPSGPLSGLWDRCQDGGEREATGNWSMSLLSIDVSLPLFLPPSPLSRINKSFLKRERSFIKMLPFNYLPISHQIAPKSYFKPTLHVVIEMLKKSSKHILKIIRQTCRDCKSIHSCLNFYQMETFLNHYFLDTHRSNSQKMDFGSALQFGIFIRC